MGFVNLNLHFPTVAAFRAWLATQLRPTWPVIGSTYHNTYKPNESQWRGHASMRSMQTTYEGLGWTTGPHLYLAVGTNHDGIFVMTPPSIAGTHSPSCNGLRFGIEVVGDFATRPMQNAQLTLLVECAAALHQWAGIGADINAHRDCDRRTCPGDVAYKQKPLIQQWLQQAMNRPYTEDSPILGEVPINIRHIVNLLPTSEYTFADKILIITTYAKLCVPLGLNPILAIAQMIHETGGLSSFWAARPRRNPAGIGVNGDTRPLSDPRPLPYTHWQPDAASGVWRFGVSFPTWVHHAIPAHLGRLLAYATLPEERTNAQQAAVDYALTWRPLPLAMHGSAPTLKGLEGTWAVPGPMYADKIAAWANRIAKVS